MMKLQDKIDLPVETLYEMRRSLEDYFQNNFCGVGVYQLFKDQIKDAIYHKLKESEDGR